MLVKLLYVRLLTALRETHSTRESTEPPAGQVEGQEYSHATYIPTLDPGAYLDMENSREYLEPPAAQVEGQEYSQPTCMTSPDTGEYEELNSGGYLELEMTPC